MNCSTRPCSRRLFNRTWPWLSGERIATTLAPIHNLAAGRQPSSPRRSRVGGRRCATPPAPRRPPPLHPPSKANPAARTNFRVDKSWEQGQSGRRRLGLAGTRTFRIHQWGAFGGQAKKNIQNSLLQLLSIPLQSAAVRLRLELQNLNVQGQLRGCFADIYSSLSQKIVRLMANAGLVRVLRKADCS